MRFAAIFLILLLFSGAARALEKEPSLPEPMAQLKKDGAQMKYLGRDLGYDGWLAVKDGQEQYFYVTPDGAAFFLGVLFNKNGRAVTFDQLKRLQGKKDPVFEDLMNAPSQKTAQASVMGALPESTPNLSVAEQFMEEVARAPAFSLGADAAPAIYMFVDPLCPHCKDMLRSLYPAVSTGRVRIEVLMVGALYPESRPLAAAILKSVDPGKVLMDMMAGKKDAVKAGPNMDDPRLDQNLSILQKWKFDATPVTTYRARDGSVKLLQGTVAKPDLILKDLP